MAAKSGHVDVSRLLLDRGADKDFKAKARFSAAQLVSRHDALPADVASGCARYGDVALRRVRWRAVRFHATPRSRKRRPPRGRAVAAGARRQQGRQRRRTCPRDKGPAARDAACRRGCVLCGVLTCSCSCGHGLCTVWPYAAVLCGSERLARCCPTAAGAWRRQGGQKQRARKP